MQMSVDGNKPPTELKLRVLGRGSRARAGLGPWVEGPGPHPPPGPVRAAPSGSRRRQRRVACPPCRAAPTLAGCRSPRARRRRAGRGERRCFAVVGPPVLVEQVLPTSAAPRLPCGAASTVKPVGGRGGGATAVPGSGGGGAGRRRERPVACSKAAMAASQWVRWSSGSHVSPAASRPVRRTGGRPVAQAAEVEPKHQRPGVLCGASRLRSGLARRSVSCCLCGLKAQFFQSGRVAGGGGPASESPPRWSVTRITRPAPHGPPVQ